MPQRTTRCATKEGGKGKARANAPYPPSRQPSNTSLPPDSPVGMEEQGMPLLRPPLPHKSSSSSSTSSSRSQRSIRPDLGMPTREQFAVLEKQYLESLDDRKKKKAMISQEMFDNIWLALHCPSDVSIETPQFRWWVRKMFALVHPDQLVDAALSAFEARPSWEKAQDDESTLGGLPKAAGVVIHDGKRVAVREHIYDILCVCHQQVKHSGRDKTSAEIRKTFTWIPKDLIALFVKNCPTCMYKKTGAFEEYLVEEDPLQNGSSVAKVTASPILCDSGLANSGRAHAMAGYIPVPSNNVIAASRSGVAFSDCGPPPLSMLAFPEYPPGPGPVALSVDKNYGSQGNLSSHPSCWQVYPSSSGCHITPSPSAWQLVPQDAAYMSHSPQNTFVQLPSIHFDGGLSSPGAYHAQPTKVTLPSFSEMFSGGLTVNKHPSIRSRPRQPLQVLPRNVGTRPGGSMSMQTPASNAYPITVHYASSDPSHTGIVPIDPALLYPADGGVRTLAFAAEAREFERFADENARM